MKMRTGFVSNSSSSSFVMVGCEFPASMLKKAQAFVEGKKDLIVSNIDGTWFVGAIIAESMGQDLKRCSVNMQKATEKLVDIRTSLNLSSPSHIVVGGRTAFIAEGSYAVDSD